jgi:hypothetical protein
MNLPTPKRLAAVAAGATTALGGVAAATYATGAPDTLVAATAGALAFGAAAVGAAVRGKPQEVQR